MPYPPWPHFADFLGQGLLNLFLPFPADRMLWRYFYQCLELRYTEKDIALADGPIKIEKKYNLCQVLKGAL